jgi:hypothetical protein
MSFASFKFLGPDDYFWKLLFLAVVVISNSDKWQAQIPTCGRVSV